MNPQTRASWKQKWIPWIKVLIPVVFSAAGLFVWLKWGNLAGMLVFIGLFVGGAMIGSRLFKKWASDEQIKADLRARLEND